MEKDILYSLTTFSEGDCEITTSVFLTKDKAMTELTNWFNARCDYYELPKKSLEEVAKDEYSEDYYFNPKENFAAIYSDEREYAQVKPIRIGVCYTKVITYPMLLLAYEKGVLTLDKEDDGDVVRIGDNWLYCDNISGDLTTYLFNIAKYMNGEFRELFPDEFDYYYAVLVNV